MCVCVGDTKFAVWVSKRLRALIGIGFSAKFATGLLRAATCHEICPTLLSFLILLLVPFVCTFSYGAQYRFRVLEFA